MNENTNKTHQNFCNATKAVFSREIYRMKHLMLCKKVLKLLLQLIA